MLSNCRYNKVKVLHDMSKLLWFIEKHGLDNANKEQDASCVVLFEKLKKDLEKYIDLLNREFLLANPELIDL